MCTVNMGKAMSRTNTSDPWETCKSFTVHARLGTGKAFLWTKCECWQSVQIKVFMNNWSECEKTSHCSFFLLKVAAWDCTAADQLSPPPLCCTTTLRLQAVMVLPVHSISVSLCLILHSLITSSQVKVPSCVGYRSRPWTSYLTSESQFPHL